MSSMAPAYIHQSPSASAHLPSLYNFSIATPTGTSISTGLAGQFPKIPLYECSFWFLSCRYTSFDKGEWRLHTLTHFRGEEPPNSVACPLCDQFEKTCDNGWISWDHRQEHISDQHLALGESVRAGRPDFHLFQHLWQKRLISDQDLKELKGGNHSLAQPPSNITVKDGRHSRDARRRGRRKAHPSAGRQANLPILSKIRADGDPLRENRPDHVQLNVPVRTAAQSISRSETQGTAVNSQNTSIEKSSLGVRATDPSPHQKQDCENLVMSHRGIEYDPERLEESQKDVSSADFVTLQRVPLATCPANEQTLDSVSDGVLLETVANATSGPSLLRAYPEDDQVSDRLSDSLRCDSDTVEDIESSDGVLEPPLNERILGEAKEQYFTQLLQSFYSNQRQFFNERTSGQGNGKGSNDTGNGKHRASSPLSADGLQAKSSKRSCRKRLDNRDGESGDENRRATPGGTPADRDVNNTVKERLFACPFVKRYPRRFFKCFSHTLKDISRVKQHLFRDKTHCLPIYCPNCSETFDNEPLRDEHIRGAQCVQMPAKKWDGITESQRRQLRKRLPSTRTPESNWFTIFEILFPGDPLPIDPYIDMALSGELRAFREHILSEGPRIWYDALTAQLPEHLSRHVEEHQSLYDSLYAESIARACESWHARTSSEDTNETQTGSEGGSVSARPRSANPELTSGHPENQQVSDVPDNLDPPSGLEETADQSGGVSATDTHPRTPRPGASSPETPHSQFHHCNTSNPEISFVDISQLEDIYEYNVDVELFHHQENPSFRTRTSNVSSPSPTIAEKTQTNTMDSLNALFEGDVSGTYPSMLSPGVPIITPDSEDTLPFLQFDDS